MPERALSEAGANQSPFFQDVDLFSADAPLLDAAKRCGLDLGALSRFGTDWGAAGTLELGRLANEHAPRLRLVDAKGGRLDRVEFHPSYHALMRKSVGYGLGALEASEEGLPATARAVRFYLAAQAEAGHLCPVTMTHAAPAALRASPEISQHWLPKISARVYDPAQKPWWEKSGVTVGMGMTERQGGTDVRLNATRAEAAGDHVEITGCKWFLSAPMCDAFLILAQGDCGLSCYLLPRFRPDGGLNGFHIQRLKDKLGNRSNATCEAAFERAFAWAVGAPGAGVRTILDMVQLTRLDCAFSSAGLMRMGLAQAVLHARYRKVFGKFLIEQPLMRAVLADLALEMEAVVALVIDLARAYDLSARDDKARAYARLLTPAVKFLVCKIAPAFLSEAMECLGGNGYVEELPLARLYREAPVNAIWEGSGNVVALDVLRAASEDRDAAMALLEDMSRRVAGVADASAIVAALTGALADGASVSRARFVCETLARFAALDALHRAGSPFAPAYAAARFEAPRHGTYGCCDLSDWEEALLERALAVG